MKAVVAAFNEEKALVGAFSVIVKTGCGTDGSICGTSHGSPEQLVVEHAGLVAGPVVLELRDVVVEGAEGVSAHQQRRALPPAQPEVLPTE